EAKRLRAEMDKHDNVNIFVSEGAGVSTIIKEMEARGEEIVRDAFGHPRLDKINPGAWFAKQFAELLGAEKTMVQKSGYFSRAAASNKDDVKLIKACAKVAVKVALDPKAKGGVVGQDENAGDKLRACEFERIKGGKPFDTDQKWFNDLLKAIGQKKGKKA
ncbi:MAG: pyrophosphate--fructose-6-phosphate 1-phosphotransferase, partial [Kiritimatiellae bacterium]|nr:pyrophosphate--fructose-6-phosphate 1-phosphotransferase [Kiritimatiellia bacterium]